MEAIGRKVLFLKFIGGTWPLSVNHGSYWAICQGGTAPTSCAIPSIQTASPFDIVFNVSLEGLPGKMMM